MYTEKLIEIFSKHQDEAQAKPMEKYMKHHFSFLGIKTPERKILLKKFYHETTILQEKELPISFIREAWSLPYREYHYAVLSVLAKRPKWLTEDHVVLLEELVTTNAWWDSVDTLATNIIGPFLHDKLELTEQTMSSWKNHDNMWLRRTAILYQLKYKHTTDEERLYEIIKQNSSDNEFFIQKAIGWALREYSKTNPESVKRFIEKTDLSSLSVREGLKHIHREKV
ncbi:DNA alkylation repair protein [Salipaludibacillus daqingensis]|uniref:DNA alkylation repair protein n=1 Tax=Salipaludibacillus daqingensis TaxID=3041001 RepID=UPI002475C1E1|nr:DNA alkylation repair protein [Salipaludibacillus daqingensis]